MKLSDVMSAMQLASYAEVALVIFFAVFLLVLAQVIVGKGDGWQRARYLPLDDEQISDPRNDRHNGDSQS